MAVQPAWSARTAAAVAVVLAALGLALAPSSPAAAAPTDLSVSVSPGSTTLQVGGGDQTISFTIANHGGPADKVRATIDIPLTGDGVRLVHGPDDCRVGGGGSKLQCDVDDIRAGDSARLFVRLRPPGRGGPGPGESRQGQGRISVQHRDYDPNEGNNSAGFAVTLKGPEQAQGVSSVSGTVKNEKSGKPVSGAKVVLTDSKDGKRSTTTNDNGQFKITSTQDKPIAPGSLSVTISKKGYATKVLTKSGQAGDAVKIDFSLASTAKASASASPTADAKDTGAADKTEAAADEGSNWGMWLVIAFGILLVLGGIGAIVMLFVRRGDESEDDLDEYGDDAPRPAQARADYPDDLYGADRYTPSHTTPLEDARPTTVMGAAGYAGADQPTSMMNRIDTDQPTRAQTAPLPDDGYRGAGYGQDGYGARGAAAPGEYGPGADYGRGEEYGSGRHGASGGYGSGGGYGADSGYRADSGYGPSSGAGYGSGGGYGGQADHGPHESGGPGGYGDYGSGAASGGYDSGAGYGSAPGSGRHSAGDNYGGYDERPPRRGSGRHSADSDDRRLDWYDD